MNKHWYRWQGNTLLLQIHLQTRAKQDQIKGLLNNRLHIHIKAVPVAGKANKYLLDLLAADFNTGKANIEIIAGTKSRNKCVALHARGKIPVWFNKLNNKDTSERD